MGQHLSEGRSRDYEIDLRFFFTVLRKCWYWVLLAAVIIGLLAGVYSSFFIPKTYSSTINMYVDPNTNAISNQYNSSTADALAATYPPVIRYSDDFAQTVAEEMTKLQNEDGAPLFPHWRAEDWRRVRTMMSTGIKEDKIFYITITSTDPAEAFRMAEIARTVAPDILNTYVSVGEAKVIGYPVQDTTPDSPSVARNVILAAVIAAVIVYVVFFLIHLFDSTIYTESDLASYEIPILGTVPTFPETAAKGQRSDKEVPAK